METQSLLESLPCFSQTLFLMGGKDLIQLRPIARKSTAFLLNWFLGLSEAINGGEVFATDIKMVLIGASALALMQTEGLK